MLYQLPDGRTVEISTYDYLEISDEELHSLIGYSYIGDYLNNPHYGSAINKPGKPEPEIPEDLEGLDLFEIPSELKAEDQDYIIDDE